MFSHEERDVSDTEEEDESYEEKNEHENNDDAQNDQENNDDDEHIVKIGDIEPSLRKVEEAMDKVEQLLLQNNFKCNICDFQAKNSNGLTMHKKAKHPDTTST